MFATWRNATLWAGLLALAACAQSSADPGDADAAGSADAATSVDAAPTPDATAAADAATSADATAADATSSADADSADATEPADAATGSDTGIIAYQHTIAIDGVNDFIVADERLATTTGGTYHGYVSWDADYVYVAMSGTDVAANNGARWVVVYLGGAGGTTAGVQYNNQQPVLPFTARYHVRWRTDNGYTHALEWSGTAWADAGWTFAGDVFQNGTFVELRIPRADIGAPTELDLHLAMVNEAGGGEWTYAGAPAASFTDGYDQDFARYYRFDLGAAAAPSSYAALP